MPTTVTPVTTGAFTWPDVLADLIAGVDLSAERAAWAMSAVMSGEATPAQIAGLVVALRVKGETATEVAGLVRAMLDAGVRIDVPGPAVDTCGTGGDRAHTVNLSTMSAFVVAGTGARVVKHGNRAASSACGSADLLEELGVAVDLPPVQVPLCVEEAGAAFCFAPLFHPALRHAAVTRRDLGVATVFNFLGPLANPAQPAAQAVGVADPRMAEVAANVLAGRGTSALVFRGDDGLDELTVTTTSTIWEVVGGTVVEHRLDPRDLGLDPAEPEQLRGGDPTQNAEAARAFLGGAGGPVRDAVLLNAAAALVALDGVGQVGPPTVPLVERLAEALTRAAAAVDSGAASSALDRWVATSRALRADARS